MIRLSHIFDTLEGVRSALQALIGVLNRVGATYGKLGLASPPGSQTLPAGSTKIDVFSSEAGVGTTPSHADNKITIDRPGMYLVGAYISLEAASGSSEMVFAVRVNNTTEVASSYATVANTLISVSFSHIVDLEVGDEVELYAAGGQDVSYSVHRIGLWCKQLSGV